MQRGEKREGASDSGERWSIVEKQRKKEGRGTKREIARPQGLVLSFYGYDKRRRRRRRREAASGAAVGSGGQREGGEPI